jgi:hypothetical protein
VLRRVEGQPNQLKNTHLSTLYEAKIHRVSMWCDMPITRDITCNYKCDALPMIRSVTQNGKVHSISFSHRYDVVYFGS